MNAPVAATRAALNNRDQYEVLRRYGAGAEISAVVAETGLQHDYVSGIVSQLGRFNRQYARTLAQEYETRRPAAAPAFVAAATADPPAVATAKPKPLPAEPRPVPVPASPAEPSPAAVPESVDELLDQAAASGDTKLTHWAARAAALIADIRERYAALEADRAAAAEIANLEERLAAARARLKGTAAPKVSDPRLGEIRAWARANHVACNPTGRIPNRVIAAYEAATGGGRG